MNKNIFKLTLILYLSGCAAGMTPYHTGMRASEVWGHRVERPDDDNERNPPIDPSAYCSGISRLATRRATRQHLGALALGALSAAAIAASSIVAARSGPMESNRDKALVIALPFVGTAFAGWAVMLRQRSNAASDFAAVTARMATGAHPEIGCNEALAAWSTSRTGVVDPGVAAIKQHTIAQMARLEIRLNHAMAADLQRQEQLQDLQDISDDLIRLRPSVLGDSELEENLEGLIRRVQAALTAQQATVAPDPTSSGADAGAPPAPPAPPPRPTSQEAASDGGA